VGDHVTSGEPAEILKAIGAGPVEGAGERLVVHQLGMPRWKLVTATQQPAPEYWLVRPLSSGFAFSPAALPSRA
jgi:hypothetical protein